MLLKQTVQNGIVSTLDCFDFAICKPLEFVHHVWRGGRPPSVEASQAGIHHFNLETAGSNVRNLGIPSRLPAELQWALMPLLPHLAPHVAGAAWLIVRNPAMLFGKSLVSHRRVEVAADFLERDLGQLFKLFFRPPSN